MLGVVALSVYGVSLYAQTDPYWDEHYDEHYYHEGDSPDAPGAVTDGTPQSTTAVAATEAAEGTAFVSTDEVIASFEEPAATEDSTAPGSESTESAASAGSAAAIDIDVGFGSSTVGGIDVDLYTVRIPYSRKLSERGTLNLTLPVSVTELSDVLFDANGLQTGDAKVYGVGLNAGYSHKVFMKKDGKPYRWKVTPSAGVFMRESSDLNQGAWVYNVGLSSSFAYRLSKHWVVNLGNSISLSWNSSRKDYPDPLRDEQQVLINGVQVFYLAGRWTHYGYVTDTRFLEDSFVDNFQTYAIGTGFKLTKKRSVKLTLIYEDGSDYEALRATVGTAWKF